MQRPKHAFGPWSREAVPMMTFGATHHHQKPSSAARHRQKADGPFLRHLMNVHASRIHCWPVPPHLPPHKATMWQPEWPPARGLTALSALVCLILQ